MISIINLFLVFTSVQASLEGDYQLLTGPKHCPTGTLGLKLNIKEANRILVFGSQHAWNLNLEDKATIKEKVEGGCTYISTYEKRSNFFQIKTQRTACPNMTENGVISETLESKNEKIYYSYKFLSDNAKKNSYQCTYSKKNK
jgi:hypothetical protein